MLPAFFVERGFPTVKQFIKALPVLSIVLALALDALLPDNLQHPAAEHPYFAWLLIAALVLYLIFYIASFARPALREKLEYKALFYAGAALFFNILNLLTVKFAVLPVLYFPSLDRVFGVLVGTARSSPSVSPTRHACCSSAGSAARSSAC